MSAETFLESVIVSGSFLERLFVYGKFTEKYIHFQNVFGTCVHI